MVRAMSIIPRTTSCWICSKLSSAIRKTSWVRSSAASGSPRVAWQRWKIIGQYFS
jgi:hypothetical protein